ncbi:MAG: hypothetical protein ACE5ES_02980, partial [Candidatus Nanoarchaeia archaeon]
GSFGLISAISIAIIILTISVAVFGINTFYAEPEYSDFCTENVRVPPKLVGEEDRVCPRVCVPLYEISEAGNCVFNECGSGCGADGLNSFETLEQCNIVADGKNCYDLYDNAREQYSKNIFLIALPLGIIILFAGAFVFGLEAVGAGLMGGGVGIIIYGIGGFWRFAQDWLKFILSLIGLIILIWFAYRYNRTGTLTFGKKRKKRRRR